MARFEVGDQVTLSYLDDHDVKYRDVRAGDHGTVVRMDGQGWPTGKFDRNDSEWIFEPDQVVPRYELRDTKRPDTIPKLNHTHAEFARNLMLEAGLTVEEALQAALALQERSE